MIKRGEGPWPSGNSEELVRQWFVERIAPGVEEDERSSVWSLCVDRLTGKTRSERIEADYKFPESVIDKLAVIADDVAKVVPEVVQFNDDSPTSLQYSKMVALLIEGMKEQQNEINKLKKLVSKSK